MSNDKAKQAAGYKAAELVEGGMRVGLGTGSTAYFFIEKLIERCKSGLKITAIATSKASEEQARQGGIEIIDEKELEALDLVVDGADEMDPNKQMIKGGGGALFREKIIAFSAREMIVVIDEGKLVERLGGHLLPIEISQFGAPSTVLHIEALGLSGSLREHGGNKYITDNGNFILDISIQNESRDLRLLDAQLKQIPGVIETGFFWDLAKRVVIGDSHGNSEVKEVL